MYATVELSKSGDGYLAEVFCSRIFRESYELQLLGYVRIPVFGDDLSSAVRRISFIYEDVLESIASWSGGVGLTGSGGNVVAARKHCKAHLQTWGEELVSADKTKYTAALYSFAVECGVNNPAALIAEVEVVGVRSIHDRIAYARRIGLLDSYGKGRIKGSNDNAEDKDTSSAEQELWEEDGLYGTEEDISEQRKRELLDRILRHGRE